MFLNLGINIIHNSYKFVEDQTLAVDDALESTVITTSFKESLDRYEIPLSIGYEFEHKEFNSFIRAGASISRIFHVSGTPEKEVILAEENITDNRDNILYMWHVGAGLKYKIPRGYLVLDIRYHYGLNNIVIPETRYKLEILGHVDDDFSLHSFTFSLGYYFSFYQSRKR